MKKIFALLLALAMVFAFFSCGKVQEEAVTVRMIALKGPTGMGVSKLMADNDDGKTKNKYNFTIAAAPTEVSAAVIGEKVDFAAMPVNLASVLINKGADISLVAVNTLGVLYVLENGNEVTDIASLKGKTIYSTGAGATPQYVLEYILEKNGIDPKKDVEITYYTDHAELATLMATGKIEIAMLPEPNVTTVMVKNSSVRKALDLTEEWEKATAAKGEKTSLAQGCLIVRTEFLEAHPNAVKAFLAAYKESVDFVNGNTEKAAQMIADAGIVPNAQIAAKALPNCNIVYMTGDEMIKTAKANFDVLFKADPTSVGGAMPGDDLYYTGK